MPKLLARAACCERELCPRSVFYGGTALHCSWTEEPQTEIERFTLPRLRKASQRVPHTPT